jgi:4-amino-4-deoxy-L-arabinose transferase-like glycosyltransferase
VRRFFPNDLPYAMQLSAQLASSLASVLLVVPMFYLGRELFDRRVAFWGALLFQCLPSSGRVMADGLSEPLFLLFAAAALALAALALRRGWAVGFGLSGIAAGLAYLTRPEGLLLPVVASGVLLGMQAFARWRRPWLTTLKCGACLTVAVLAVSLPYMHLIGGITQKRGPNLIFGTPRSGDDWKAPDMTEPQSAVTVSPAPLAMWWTGDEKAWTGRTYWAVLALRDVLVKGFFFVLWLPALAGLYWFRDRFRETPAAWLLLALSGLFAAGLYLLALKAGYLSDRHTLLILMCGVFWVAAPFEAVGRKLAALVAGPVRRPWNDGRVWAAAMLLPLLAPPLWRTLEPLHADRAGFRTAGYWLAKNVPADEAVFDPYGWAGYYAGHSDDNYLGDLTKFRYVVLETANGSHSHLPTVPLAETLAKGGTLLYVCPATRGKGAGEVRIYSLRAP